MKNSQERYPYLKRIIPILINGNWVWGGVRLSHVTGYPINQLQLESPEALSARITDTGIKPVFKSPLYEGFNINNVLVIRFKPTT
jgi:hypothetical protein